MRPCESYEGTGDLVLTVVGDVLSGAFGFVFWADVLCLMAIHVLLLPEVLRKQEGRGRRTFRGAVE